MNDRQHVYELSPRECEVLELVAQGLTNMEISRKLGIVERTARTHVYYAMDKLGVGTRTEAARYVWQQRMKEAYERGYRDGREQWAAQV